MTVTYLDIEDCKSILENAVAIKDLELIRSVQVTLDEHDSGYAFYTLGLESGDFIFEVLIKSVETGSTGISKFLLGKINTIIDSVDEYTT